MHVVCLCSGLTLLSFGSCPPCLAARERRRARPRERAHSARYDPRPQLRERRCVCAVTCSCKVHYEASLTHMRTCVHSSCARRRSVRARRQLGAPRCARFGAHGAPERRRGAFVCRATRTCALPSNAHARRLLHVQAVVTTPRGHKCEGVVFEDDVKVVGISIAKKPEVHKGCVLCAPHWLTASAKTKRGLSLILILTHSCVRLQPPASAHDDAPVRRAVWRDPRRGDRQRRLQGASCAVSLKPQSDKSIV